MRLRWITLLLLIAASGFIHSVSVDRRFHPDEAYFASYAMRAALQGDWLLHGDLDKPPLAIYAQAVSMSLFAAQPNVNGVLDFTPQHGEFAARLPSMFAAMITAAAAFKIARTIYPDGRVAIGAGMLVGLSPLLTGFGGSAFTDSLMVMFTTLSLWSAVRGRSWSTGAWLALGFACKQQALFMLPLIIGVLWLQRNWHWRMLIGVGTPIILAFGVLTLWDAARGQAVSMWALAAANNSPGRLVRYDEMTRLNEWLDLSRGWFGYATALIVPIGVIGVMRLLDIDSRLRTAGFDVLFFMFAGGYWMIHVFVAFNTYDRYLLIALVPLSLFCAHSITRLLRWAHARDFMPTELIVVAMVGVIGMITASRNIAEGITPYNLAPNSFTRAQDTIALTDFLNAQPLGTVIYDHWYGWELDYYLGTWSNKRRAYYPTPQALAAGALALNESQPRLFIAPVDQPHGLWIDALTDAGFSIEMALTTNEAIVYRLTPSDSGDPSG